MYARGNNGFRPRPPVHPGMQLPEMGPFGPPGWICDHGPQCHNGPMPWGGAGLPCGCRPPQPLNDTPAPPPPRPHVGHSHIKQEAWDPMGECGCPRCGGGGWRRDSEQGMGEWRASNPNGLLCANHWGQPQPPSRVEMHFAGCAQHHHHTHARYQHPESGGLAMGPPFPSQAFGFHENPARLPQNQRFLDPSMGGGIVPPPHRQAGLQVPPGPSPQMPRPPTRPQPRPPPPSGPSFRAPSRHGQCAQFPPHPPAKMTQPSQAASKVHKQQQEIEMPLAVCRPTTAEEQEDVMKWLEDRRRNYPSQENLKRKQQEFEERRKRGEVDSNAERKVTLKDIVDRQKSLGVDRAAGTSFMFQGGSGRGPRGRGRAFGRMWYKGRGRFPPGKRSFEPLEGPQAVDSHKGGLDCGGQTSQPFVQHKKMRSVLQGKEPSLLDKLLYRELRRDKSYILQCLRFLSENAFLQELGRVPLVFPENAAGEGVSSKEAMLPNLPPIEDVSETDSESADGDSKADVDVVLVEGTRTAGCRDAAERCDGNESSRDTSDCAALDAVGEHHNGKGLQTSNADCKLGDVSDNNEDLESGEICDGVTIIE